MTKERTKPIEFEVAKGTKELLLCIAELKKKNTELEKDKAYTEGQLDEQIQATLKLQKENAELKSRDCWKSCEYANPKAELIEQHIKDVQDLTKAKEIIRAYKNICNNAPFLTEEEVELKVKAEQFLSDSKQEEA